MSGADQMRDRRWSARQRLVVLTFGTPEDAAMWDVSPRDVEPLMTTPIDFDAPTIALMETCGSVIDEWQQATFSTVRLDDRIERMRGALFALHQSRRRLSVVKP